MEPPGTTTPCRLRGLGKFLPDDILSGMDLVLKELFVQLMRLRNFNLKEEEKKKFAAKFYWLWQHFTITAHKYWISLLK